MIHEEVDIVRWKTEFPLERLRREARDFVLNRRAQLPDEYPDEAAVERHIRLMEPDADVIVGPEDIAIVEQLREEANVPASVARIPTDIFVMARGEPTAREVTKLGGLPYWPAGRPWPVSILGEPMTFVAQFCFADSHDLVGELPGDVLLIFGEDHDSILERQGTAIQFHWMNLGQSALIAVDQIPSTSWKFSPCYGQLFSTHDMPSAQPHLEGYRGSENMAVLEGTKIGGVPKWIQGDGALPGRFLCALGSISVNPDRPYRFVNVSEPVGWDQDFLMWGDMGSLYVFMAANGELSWASQCY